MTGSLGDREKTILTGRIYPAITACVGNRYKIILSFFAYYSFILNARDVPIFKNLADRILINRLVSIIFTLFILQNSLNYLLNAKEQMKLEDCKEDWSTLLCNFARVEGFFLVVSVVMVWTVFCLIGSK